jgi:uncharacterized protein YkwD
VRRARPTGDGWSEPSRQPADWPRALSPDQEQDSDPSQDWAHTFPQRRPWSVQPPPTQPQTEEAPEPANGPPWAAQPWDNGASPAPSPSQPWQASEPAASLPWHAQPPQAQPWDWDDGSSPSQPWDGSSPSQPWDGSSPSQPWDDGSSPGLPWGAPLPASQTGTAADEPSQGQAWVAQLAQLQSLVSQAQGTEAARPQRLTEPAPEPARWRRGVLQGRGPLAIAIAIPLVISLVLLVTAGPGRVLPRKGAQAAKRPVAAPVQPGELNRLATLVNQERARNGLPALRVLRKLNAVAAAHSAEMASQKRIHPDPNVAVHARPATSVSQYVDCASNVDQAYQRMFASATWRAKILSPSLNGIGSGTVSGTCLWVTVLFARAATPASAAKPAAPAAGGSSTRAAPVDDPPDQTVSTGRGPGPPSSTAQAIAKDLFTRVNLERKARGLAPLAWNDDLASLATNWSGEMARSGNFTHRDLDAARGRPGIAQFSALGENIAWLRGYEDDGYQFHLGWMRSEGHRRNLLQPGYDTIGIGVVCSGGKAWATQNFGRLSASAPALTDSTPAAEPVVATTKDGLTC